ncbi:MAG TPA: DUF4012 domain-containing protein [Nitriliruptorales bacterium]|nr:DUF4012 domain-containing protein [Nitriliruptorales bacterium]
MAAAVLVRDALTTRAELEDARVEFTAAQAAVADGDVDAAGERLAAARTAINAATVRTNRLLWQAGELVPLAGRSLRVVGAVVEVADAAAHAGRQVIHRTGALLGPGGELALEVSDGQVRLAPLRQAAAALGEVDLGPLTRAREELADTPASLLPTRVRDGRREALDLSARVLATVSRAERLTAALPPFLGSDGPRRYFLAMQNNAELRGTGGLIGFYAVLTVEDGAFTLSEPQVYGVLDRAPEDPEEDYAPVQASDAFERRYGHTGAAGFFANVNLDPDLPTTARVLLDLYAKRTGQQLDGVIAVDPIGLSAVLAEVGAVTLPPEVADPSGSIPNPLPADQLARATMVDVYDVFGGNSPERKNYLRGLATASFERLFAGGWDAVAVARRLATAASSGHLQLFSEHDTEQDAFRALGIGGALGVAPPGQRGSHGERDLLAVTANNAGGNKMDVHVGHRIGGEIRLTAPDGDQVQRQATLGVAVDNPLATDGHDPYIVGNCLITGGADGCYDGPPGLNRTWFTVWAPEPATALGARDADGDRLLVGLGRIHGQLAVDHFLETPARSRNHFVVDLAGSAPIGREGADLVYRLTLWRQAKAVPDRLELTVVAPDGWDVAGAAVDGGGAGSGMGLYGEPGPPVAAAVHDDRVRLTGDANAHVTVTVRFTRSVVDRVWDWLHSPAI